MAVGGSTMRSIVGRPLTTTPGPFLAGTLALALFVPACSDRVPVGEHDGGTVRDASSDRDATTTPDAGSDHDAAVAPDAGSDRDAAIDGAIGADAGWCECPPPLPGCRYVGVPCPCDELACDDAGAPRFCGGFAGFTCATDEFCDYAEPHTCGGADESGVCQPRPTICPPVIAEVCGCDGVTYSSACDAHAAGIDVLHHAPCGTSDCAPEDARGEGFCAAIVGVAWDGSACQWLSGCSCVGADCGRWSSIEECDAAHAHCPTVPPPPE